MSFSYDQRLCDILGKCAAFSWLARGRRCNAVRKCNVATPKGRVTKADKCLRLTRMFQYEEEGDHLCTTDLLLAEIWARKYHLQKMEWVNGLIMWHFTRSAQPPQCHRQATPSTTTPPTSPNDAAAAPPPPPPPQPPKRTVPLLRIRPPGKCSSVKCVA